MMHKILQLSLYLVFLIDNIRMYIGSLMIRDCHAIKQLQEGEDPNGQSNKFAVYVHYDKNGKIADYVVNQVEAIHNLGYRIVFVTNSKRMDPDEFEAVKVFCWKVLQRKNIGHDFGGYRTGLSVITNRDKAERLLLTNDSCYGPLFELNALEQAFDDSIADFWGVTDSWWHRYHIQSYYMIFSGTVARSISFSRFWTSYATYQPRRLVIRNGEIKLTQTLLKSGFKSGVLCPYWDVAKIAACRILDQKDSANPLLNKYEADYLEHLYLAITKGVPLNQTHSFWDVLIAEFSNPFLKRDLLRKNPTRIPAMMEWRDHLRRYSSYNLEFIENHLRIH